MKILSLVTIPSSKQGGMEWSSLEVCRGLAQRGHEIHLVHKEDGNFLPIYQEFCTTITKTQFHQNYFTHPVHATLSLAKGLLPTLKIRPDVVYIQKFHNSYFASQIAKLKRVPLVCHLRAFPPSGEFNHQWSLGLNAMTRCIAVSEATKTAYLKTGFNPEVIKVVYNGIDLEKFSVKNDRGDTRGKLHIPNSAFVALYAGRVDPPKNIEMLIRAFSEFTQTVTDAHLLIVGGPVNHDSPEAGEHYMESLKQLGKRLDIAERIHFLGKRRDMAELYRAADVTVLPSMLPDTFGRTLAESMACGVPAAGLRYGGIPEVISDEFSRFQFDVDDIDGLAKILRSLVGWQHDDPTLSQRCRTYAETRFSLTKTVEGVERVLEEAVGLGALRLGPPVDILDAWGDRVASNPDIYAGYTAHP
jgi:glycosyltransferase involved in cell wall biosynthesis